MHQFEEGFSTGFADDAGRQAEGALDFLADMQIALLRLPVPDIGAGAGQGQGTAAGLAEEVARQKALAESEVGQGEAYDHQHRAEPGQEDRRDRHAVGIGDGGDGGNKGPEQDGRPGDQRGFRLVSRRAATGRRSARNRHAAVMAKRPRANPAAMDRFGKAIDRHGKRQPAQPPPGYCR